MPPRINHKSSAGASFWVVINIISWAIVALAVLLVAGWFVYIKEFKQPKAHRIMDISAAASASTSATPTPPRYECPLDGTLFTMDNRSDTARRPLVVQVDNAPGAQPQAGLSQADIIYEAMAEGEITRFSAIFLCHDADVIGPVRSARLVDLELAPEYNALLVNSGSSEGVTEKIESQADIINMVESNYPAAFWRTPDRVAPHNLVTGTRRLRNAAAAAGVPVDLAIPSLLFKDDTPAPDIQTIGIYYSPWVDILYRYDPASNSWLRFLNGESHDDSMTGSQLAAKNVIVQYVDITESDIVEDAGGNRGLAFRLIGQGRAQIFQDGRVIDCFWIRDGRNSLTYYVDSAEQLIPLNRGLTFVQLVPLDFRAQIK